MATEKEDPVAYAAKFLWVWSLIPLILAGVVYAIEPGKFFQGGRAVVLVWPVLVAAIGLGVQRRSRAAVWAGIALFGLIGAAMAVFSVARGAFAGVLWVGLVAWPIVKLRNALRALTAELDATR